MSEESKNQKKSRRKALKVIKWGFILSAGIVLLIFFGLPLYLSSSGGTNFLLGKINQSVDGQVQMDDFSMGWFKGVKLTNLSYADSTGNTSVNAERVETQPRYMSLLAGKVKLGKTIIDQPRVYVKVPMEQKPHSGTEKAEIPSAKASSVKSDAPPPVFPVNQIDLELIDGNATVEMLGDVPQTVVFKNITSNVQFDQAAKSGSMDMTMDAAGSPISAKGNVNLDKTGWKIQAGEFDVKVSKLQLASLKPVFALMDKKINLTGNLNTDMTVVIDDNNIKRIQGNYALDTELAGVQQLAEEFNLDMPDMSMAGALSLSGQASMNNDAIEISGTGEVKQLVIQKQNIKTPVTDMQVDFNCALDNVKEQLRISSANLAGTPGTVKIRDLIMPRSEQADQTLSMNAHASIDLEKVWPFLQIAAGDLGDKKVAGLMDAAVNISTTGSQVHLLTENSKINNLKIAIPDSEPFVQDMVVLDADILLDTDKQTIDIKTLDMRGTHGETLINVTKGTVKKKVSKSQTEILGDFEVEYDWQAVSSFASIYLPDGLQLRGKRKDAFHFESTYPSSRPETMTANLDAKGSLGFASAEYFGLNFGPTELGIDVQKGVARLNIPQTTVNNGTLQFSGIMDLNEKPGMLRLAKPMSILDKVHINDTMTRLLLMYTNPMFVDASQASGIASFYCRQMSIPLTGDDNNLLAIDGTFQIDSLRMRAGSFTKQILALFKQPDMVMMKLHPTDFLLRNGFLSYQDMQIDVEDNPLNFRGRIGLDNSLAMDVTLPWTLEFENVKVGDRSTDRFTLPIEGTLDRPRIDTGKLLEQQGRQLLEKELKKQLERLFE
ncbi:MAG: AsmA family protein [Planctomycetota bacterium]|jgi:hypothetical protein